MKRIYTVCAVVGLCAVSASAFTPRTTAFEKVFTTAQNETKKFQNNLEVTPLAPSNISTRASIAPADVNGYYLYQAYWKSMGLGGFLFEVAENGKDATLSDLFYYPANIANRQYANAVFNVTFDSSTGIISIPNQVLGLGQLNFEQEDKSVVAKDVKFVLQIGEFYQTGEVDDKGKPKYAYRDLDTPMQIQFNPENGLLLWPEYGVWSIDVYDPTTGDAIGYYLTSQLNSSIKIANELDNTDWQDWGKASFTDGWVAPAYKGATPADMTWEVTVQKSKTTQGLIRIVDPYGASAPDYIKKDNLSPCQGAILIDMADKDCVLALPDIYTPSGMYVDGEGMLYTYSEIGLEYYNYLDVEGEEPYTYEELIDSFGTDAIGKVEGRNMEIYGCEFGFSMWQGIFGEYSWGESENPDEDPAPVTAYLTLPDDSGVNDILVDANAPVKYFNLQGMEVANPEAGQVVIKKKGSKATKFIAK